MNDRQDFKMDDEEKVIRILRLFFAVAVTFALGLFLAPQAEAADIDGWEGWPKQSRAERLGTFTYVYGGAGFVSHTGSDEGAEKYQGFESSLDGGNLQTEPKNAEENSDDMAISGGFGVRFPNDWNFEFGLTVLNGAYDQPTASGSTNPKPDQPVFEMSVLKGFKLGGPPLLRYTLRAGFASIDDPHTDDGGFFGIGVAHEPFRVELRQYDFGVFDSQVLQVQYVCDF